LVFQATGNNPSACLTFRFTSDTYNNAPGWAATISCAQVCHPINAVLASSTPTAINNVIQICKGGTVNLQGTAVFDVVDENATYEWNMGKGDIVQGQDVTYVYTEEGIYK